MIASRLVLLPLSCLSLLSIASVVQAGVIANGEWSPTGCGTRPEVPALNIKSEAAYNLSIDAANAYLQKIRTYIDCLAQEANADIGLTTQSANLAQQAAAAAREKLLAEVKTAEQKLNKK